MRVLTAGLIHPRRIVGEQVRVALVDACVAVNGQLWALALEIGAQLAFGLARRGDPRPQDAGSMGLGLYIANEIVKGHGGRIDLDSSDARGTTFTVHLPRHPPAS